MSKSDEDERLAVASSKAKDAPASWDPDPDGMWAAYAARRSGTVTLDDDQFERLMTVLERIADKLGC